MNRFPLKYLILLALMLLSAGLAAALRPTVVIADQRAKVDLEQLIPRQFGDWRELQQSSAQIVNPQTTELLKKLYSQTLSRTYINSAGGVIMLSIAYGANQTDSVQLHYPEVCYPAQGFQMRSNTKGTLDTAAGSIRVKRLLATLGNRSEPITYWTTMGDKVVYGGMETKLTQMQYGFRGEIPDGLIFRISSIAREASTGHEMQARFARDFVDNLPAATRTRLTGLAG